MEYGLLTEADCIIFFKNEAERGQQYLHYLEIEFECDRVEFDSMQEAQEKYPDLELVCEVDYSDEIKIRYFASEDIILDNMYLFNKGDRISEREFKYLKSKGFFTLPCEVVIDSKKTDDQIREWIRAHWTQRRPQFRQGKV